MRCSWARVHPPADFFGRRSSLWSALVIATASAYSTSSIRERFMSADGIGQQIVTLPWGHCAPDLQASLEPLWLRDVRLP